MANYTIKQHRQRAEKILRVCELIEYAEQKKKAIENSYYYKIFGTSKAQQKDLEFRDAVINRLVNYLNQIK
jgi:hypothetical protein